MTYDEFLREVCPRLDLNWRKYRRKSARRRVAGRMGELGLTDYADFVQRIQGNPDEARLLPDRMRVTVSRFFRERERWEALARAVIPELLDTIRDDAPFRAWSVGCCNGEEPYTLAALWLDRIQPEHPGVSLDVLATDIDEAVLGRAGKATYDRGTLREVPVEILRRWFTATGSSWTVRSEVSARVRFVRHHLMEDLPPKGVDLICCRYLVFTYYKGERRHRASRRLWGALRPGGALMIGRKEGLSPRDRELFAPWPRAEGVFRKVEG